MKVQFTIADPRDFPTLGLSAVAAGDTADVPDEVAADLFAQGAAEPLPEKPTKTKE